MAVSSSVPSDTTKATLGFLSSGVVLLSCVAVALGLGTARLTSKAPSQWVNVVEYGAVGDGVTDDTQAIMAAVSALGASGSTLFFPPGTYLLGQQIALPSNSELRGSGAGASRILRKAGLSFTPVSAVGSQNIAIRDVAIDGSTAGSSGNLLHVDNSSHVSIHAVAVTSTPHAGIRVSGSNVTDVSITATRIGPVGNEGIVVVGTPTSPARRIVVDSCIISDTGQSGIYLQDSADVTISANNLALPSCSSNPGYAAIVAEVGCYAFSITANSIRSYSRGIWVHDSAAIPASRATICGNTIAQTCKQAIWVAGADCTITGNVIDDPCRAEAIGSRIAILIHNNGPVVPDRVIVSQTVIKDNGAGATRLLETGILITQGQYHIVTNNIIKGSTVQGYSVPPTTVVNQNIHVP